MKNSIYTTWPLYLAAVLLILNDHVFKYLFPSILTGKLSDIAGLFLVTLVLRELLPKNSIRVSLGIVVVFAFWKSHYSQLLIDIFNSYSPIYIGRVVDYSDLLAFFIIPVAHHVYEKREKFTIRAHFSQFIRVPAIIVTVFGVTGTSVLLPHHNYEIRKEVSDQKIDIRKTIGLIKVIADYHDLLCIECDPAKRGGSFESSEIKLQYRITDNDRGIEFDIEGEPGGIFFGDGSWDEMDVIKSSLQYSLGYELKDMEFVIKLGQR